MGNQETGSLKTMLANLYLERYAYPKELISAPPHPELNLIVVIPCYHEPDLIGSLESLYHCKPTSGAVAVIVVINQSEDSPPEVTAQNLKAYETAQQWASNCNTKEKQFHILFEDQLPAKHAGVGLARKIGMDEAVRRFEKLDRHERGIIVCFDADCTCEPNYLKAIEDHFDQTKTTAATIYFEHPMAGSLAKNAYRGICHYELFLRYYRQALKYIGYPYPYFTVGSCLAVRSLAYQKQGGMNRRRAGEDFYFIEEHCRMGHITEITATTVFPSPRVSDRVPFGTGKRQSQWILSDQKEYLTFHPESFQCLKWFFEATNQYYKMTDMQLQNHFKTYPSWLKIYLTELKAVENIAACRQQTGQLQVFKKRFYQWFNGLRILQFLHHAQSVHQDINLVVAARWMLKEKHGIEMENSSAATLLETYRQLDKQLNQIH